MNDLDIAIRAALILDESNAPPAPPTWTTPIIIVGAPRQPTHRWLTAVAVLLAIAGLAAVVAKWDATDHTVVPAAPNPTTVLPQQERARAAAIEAEVQRREAAEAAARARANGLATTAAQQQMAHDVVAAAADVGWRITLPTDLISQSSTDDGQGVQYFEVRLTDSAVGQLLVSIRTGDAAAVAAGTTNRTGLLQSDGSASVYLGTDSAQARAVELFDGTTIIYIRSESSNQSARALSDLTAMALALNRIR